MNLGDGLLFELENGKPKLILLSRGVEKNPAKLSFRPRAAHVLSSRQPSCVEEAQGEERPARQQQAGRPRDAKGKAGGAAPSFTSTCSGGRSTTLTSSKMHHKGPSAKAEAKVKTDRHQRGPAVGSLRTDGRPGRPQNSGPRVAGKEGLTGPSANGDAGPKESVVCLTNQQLQKILHTVQTSSVGQHPPENPRTQVNQNDSKETVSSTNGDDGGGGGGGGGGEMKEEDRGGGGTDSSGRSRDKDNRPSGCPFSWLEERHSDSRAAIDAKKALWRRELDEQVALKQQCSAPGRLQAEEDTESVFSVQSSLSHRDQPAAIRSSLRLGEVTPMEEVLSLERREAQRRRWLEELDQQREETSERRRREKLLQSQTEDHELWATHFDSMQRRPPVQAEAPSAPSALSMASERGGWEPSSSLSLVWEATSSCGAESVGGASVDATSGYLARASYLRTMTALLDPAQIEERERRRLKQLEQQRAIEAQVEERRLQRRREEARRREELEEDERKVALEREMLERQYKLDTLRERQKVGTQTSSNQAETETVHDDHDDHHDDHGDHHDHHDDHGDHHDGRRQEAPETSVTRKSECLEEDVNNDTTGPAPSLPLRVQTPGVSAQYQPPPLLSAAPPNVRNRAVRTGKENVCLSGGGGGGGGTGGRTGAGAGAGGGGGGGGDDPYEAFARTERSRGDKRRPEWNTQRPSRRFVPASERYPAPLQRNRQESRQRRQAELLALQERTCLSRTDPPPPPPPPPQHQEPRLCSNPTQTRTSPTRRVENGSRGQNILAVINTERGRSPPDPTARQRVQSQQAASSSAPPPPPLLPLEFIPYVRSDEVFNMDPLEPADTPPPHTHTAPPQSSASPPSHRLLHSEPLRNAQTQRQQEILRGLAQLRQGLLQKQRELETDLNPLLKRHDNEHRPPAAMKRK
ncbi:coiled-coil domain-containing protein 66 isoform X2 [Cyclopterus lumpus]|uniref:coiled-coil domain-containing protein 66 isoform X2 n=1 Tax=Cyclopterus lumpus TaxID=8103 RepID=UPI001486B161|nr:coiled-coil domain-containing protein 66 isoform X2 [Cyclopterus lumpus]